MQKLFKVTYIIDFRFNQFLCKALKSLIYSVLNRKEDICEKLGEQKQSDCTQMRNK